MSKRGRLSDDRHLCSDHGAKLDGQDGDKMYSACATRTGGAGLTWGQEVETGVPRWRWPDYIPWENKGEQREHQNREKYKEDNVKGKRRVHESKKEACPSGRL